MVALLRHLQGRTTLWDRPGTRCCQGAPGRSQRRKRSTALLLKLRTSLGCMVLALWLPGHSTSLEGKLDSLTGLSAQWHWSKCHPRRAEPLTHPYCRNGLECRRRTLYALDWLEMCLVRTCRRCPCCDLAPPCLGCIALALPPLWGRRSQAGNQCTRPWRSC